VEAGVLIGLDLPHPVIKHEGWLSAFARLAIEMKGACAECWDIPPATVDVTITSWRLP
jgi:hypothetical protein